MTETTQLPREIGKDIKTSKTKFGVNVRK